MPKATITLPDGPRRTTSAVWWLGVLILGVLVLGWAVLYGKLNSMSKTLDQAVTEQTVSMSGCSATKSCTYRDMTLCFLQVGADSGWRFAMSASVKETAQNLGVTLMFSEMQATQLNQISSMRFCIQQGVSVIALVPATEDSWEEVLTEARDAGIPVMLVDRSVSAAPSLYASHIGPNMELEGKRAASEFNKLLPNGGTILEVSGTTGSSAAVGRGRGFREVLNANVRILDSQDGNFTRAEALLVMQALLKKHRVGTDFQGIFVHNDDMGMGVVEALKEAGIKPGELFLVSVDGTRGGFQAMVDGWFQADVECNPLLGPQVFELALKLMNGEPVTREVLANETVYYPADAAELLPTRLY